ncbi:hypothetical protein [Paenibacillus lignilyticus]|uniref:Uncharacterized protein n=1 Tax=Paenibacillus lignilyticus TaxID=1172615 RepID=A0ABS5CM21_9BACL|nr:hypothetical protein [Paenibacillus lignilyticus]MBP3966917.1 hypothetical protein [Paenibacillus lignilyticus]
MAQKWMKIGIMTLASALLIQGTTTSLLNTNVASAASSGSNLISSKIVKLNASAYLTIRDVHFLMQGKGKVLVYSVSITNNGNSSLDLMDYWLRVKTKTGKSFKSSLIESDKDKKEVAAKTTQYLTYYTVVDNQTKLSDLAFQVVKWDFSAANYEKVLGNIQYPANATDKVTPYQAATMLYDNNKVRSAIKQAYITKDSNNAYLVMNVLLENVGFQSSDLSKMNFFIQTDSLSVYNVAASGLDQTSIQPKERKIVTLHATIPLAVAGKALSLVVAQNDDASKVQLPVGVFALPTTKPLVAAPVGKTRMVYVTGTPVNTLTGQAFVSQGTSNKDVSLDFTLTNIGAASVASPSWDYFIVTASGTSYPLNYTREENAVLLPQIEKTISLSGQLPTNLSLSTAQLVVKSQATDKEKSYIVGTYSLQSTTQQGTLGGSFAYNDFAIKLNTIQRTPNSDHDVLLANLTVTNKSTISQQIPNLGGYFMVNGVKVGTEQKAVALDNSITIAPGASANFVVYSDIPYTTSIDKITFVSTETIQDKAGKQLYQFSAQNLSEVASKKLTDPYKINNLGKRSTVSVTKTAIFDGLTKNNFYAELEAVNNELRTSPIAQLGGYIVDKNGVVVPVQFATVKDKLSPSGKALLSAWASISKKFDTTSYKFVLGQSITTGTSGGTTTPDNGEAANSVLVDMVSYPLTATATATTNNLSNIQFPGYTLGLNYINAFLNVTGDYQIAGMKMTMDSSLWKSTDYEVVAGDHKVLIEFVNQDNSKLTFSKQFSINAASENEEQLKEAINNPLTLVFNDPDVQAKIQRYDGYKLNVYDVFENTKLLVASKDLKWFVTTP